MPKSQQKRHVVRPPKYCHHKGSGQAYVRINGVDRYLGIFGTEASKNAYAKLIAEFTSGAVIDAKGQTAKVTSGLTVAEIVLAYMKHAERYYRKNDRPTDELGCIKCAIRPLVDLFGDTNASEFGPIALKAVRQSMVNAKKLKPVPGSVAPHPIYKNGVRTKPQRKLVEAPRYCRRFINMSMGRIRRVFKWAIENELVEPDVLAKLQAVAPLTAGRTMA